MVTSRARRSLAPPMEVRMEPEARGAVSPTRTDDSTGRLRRRSRRSPRGRLERARERAEARRDPVDASIGTTILVVDDEHRIAALVCKGLHARGYRAESVGTGRAALSRLSQA